jgi:8-amino-7-oxononanoate synthase
MLDFTSALYLGLRHASTTLRPWAQLTTGAPAALSPPPGGQGVARRVAALQGCEAGTLAPSTLHLFWDLFGILAREAVAIYLDDGAYPIGRWGVERAAALGVPVRNFAHHDPDALRRQLRHDARRGLRPVVVADGYCPSCGVPAPVGAYRESVRAFGGYLVLDDTQALGVFGWGPAPDAPYGRGGGGTLPRYAIGGPDMLVVSSLAKGFGVPGAVLAGGEAAVRHFEAHSATRVHCSPASAAVVHATEHALTVNQAHGDELRLRLAGLVRRFRTRLAEAGISAIGGLFPVQTLAPLSFATAEAVHAGLLLRSLRAVLTRPICRPGAAVSFLITARHRPGDIDRAAVALAEAFKARAFRPVAEGQLS